MNQAKLRREPRAASWKGPEARQLLPEKFIATAACSVGRALDARVDPRWLWKGRRVYLFDGTTVNMPDTSETGFDHYYVKPVAMSTLLTVFKTVAAS